MFSASGATAASVTPMVIIFSFYFISKIVVFHLVAIDSNLAYTQIFILYRAVNTLRLGYKNNSLLLSCIGK
jgi:hypothetical protein